MDKLRAMKFFCRTVEAKSFTSAAHDLDVAPSVLSKVMSALEADLRFTLFNRSTRRLSLTEAGARYYERCRRLLVEMEEAESVARAGAVQPTGTLRVGVHPVFRNSLIRELGDFLASNPEVNIETTLTNSPTALLEQGLDVVLLIGKLADSDFIGRQVGTTALVTCAAPAYLDRQGRPRHPRDVADHRAIVPGRRDESLSVRWTFARGKEREVVAVRPILIARDGIGLVDAALGGVGITRIYDLAANRHLADGGLETILPTWSCGREPIYAVFPSRRNVPAKVRVFLDFVGAFIDSVAQTTR
jgi:LysR family transcriptional regulator, regulator for bpeEF and oprC